MYSIIDGHVHGRDWKQAHKETLVNLFKLAQMISEYKDFRLGAIPADSVSVYQSQLMPKGPIYTVLGNYRLQ